MSRCGWTRGPVPCLVLVVMVAGFVPTVNGLALDGWVTGLNSGGIEYTCSKGWFQPKESLDQFGVAFRERSRDIGTLLNKGGMGMGNSYSLWQVITELKPLLVVEVGIWNGRTSYMIRKAVNTYGGAITVRLDPQDRPERWRDDSPNNHDWVGRDFRDFNRIDWESHFDKHVRENALVIFDDHMNQVIHVLAS